jgi:hypothetical protein
MWCNEAIKNEILCSKQSAALIDMKAKLLMTTTKNSGLGFLNTNCKARLLLRQFVACVGRADERAEPLIIYRFNQVILCAIRDEFLRTNAFLVLHSVCRFTWRFSNL